MTISDYFSLPTCLQLSVDPIRKYISVCSDWVRLAVVTTAIRQTLVLAHIENVQKRCLDGLQ